MKKKNIPLILFILVIYVKAAIVADFTFYPEEQTDLVNTKGEIFYGAYYFSNSGVTLKDKKNGVLVSPTKDCIIHQPIYSNSDTVTESNVPPSVTFERQFLLNTMSSTTGVICNVDMIGNLMSNFNTVKVYLWVINTSPNLSSFRVIGCSSSANCNADADFDTEIPGGNLYSLQYSRQVEILTISKSARINMVTVSLNGGTATDVGYTNKLYLKFTSNNVTDVPFKFSYLQLNILANTNLLLGSGTCISGKDCVPGYQCSFPSCSGKCHPSCDRCEGTVPFGVSGDFTKCKVCSKISSGYASEPNGGVCNPIDHVDITQLSNLSMTFPSRTSEGFTIDFWMYVEDQTQFGDKIINVILDNVMMLSVGLDTNISSICNIHLARYPNLKTISSFSSLKLYLKANNLNFVNTQSKFSSSMNSKWFYSRCGFSNLNSFMYSLLSYTQSNFIDEYADFPNPSYFNSSPLDSNFSLFLGQSLNLNINNASTIPTQIYMKNLHVYSELLPKTSGVQYFDWNKINNNSSFPALYVNFNIDSLSITTSSSNTMQALINFVYYNNSNNLVTTPVNSCAIVTGANFAIPTSFYRLNFLSPNMYYLTSDLINTKELACESPNMFCSKNNFPINCRESFYYDSDLNICASSCPKGKMPSYSSSNITPNVSNGFCNFECSANLLCTPSSGYNKFSENLTCAAGFTRSHMNCYPSEEEDEGALFYSSYYQAQPAINIPIAPTLNNYILEVWVYPDRVLTPLNPTSGNKYFILLTSGLSIFRDQLFNNANTYQLQDSLGNIFGSALTFNYSQWYKLSYRVTYDASTGNFTTTFFYNKYTGNITSTSLVNMSLSSISFCNTSNFPNCSSLWNVQWFSAFYKSLRIWDATGLSSSLYQSFDQIFNFSKLNIFPRFSSNIYYFPLSFFYSKNQKLSDPDKTKIGSPVSTALSQFYKNFMIKPWNTSANFDYIKSNNLSNKYVSSTILNSYGLYDPTVSSCSLNCDICNSNECVKCSSNSYLVNGNCVSNAQQNYYFLSPIRSLNNPNSPLDLIFNNLSQVSTKFTISFFIKLLGNGGNSESNSNNSNFDIIRLSGTGASNCLSIRYDTVNKNLQLYQGTITLGNFINFNNLIGMWTHISLAYNYDSKIASYFPAMMNFQVNFQQVPIMTTSNVNMSSMSIVIPKESIAVYAKLWIWDVYLVGSWAFMSYKSRSVNPFKKLFDSAQTDSDCLSSLDVNNNMDNSQYLCVLDYNVMLDESKYCSSSPSFVDATGTCLSQSSCQYGYYTPVNVNSNCACTLNSRNVWISKNSNAQVCRNLDYVDFNRYSPSTVTEAFTGSTGYTIEFWSYINTYVNSSYTKGFEIIWDKQLKVNLSYAAGSLQSTCYPIYDSFDPSKQSSDFNSVKINTSQWTYIRCSVDLINRLYFQWREGLVTTEQKLNGTPPLIPSITTFSLFENSVNYGVVFFRQIRLWDCYNCINPDGYQIEMTNLTVNKYNNLLHLWDPVWSNGITSVADVKSNKNLNLSQNPLWREYNAVDDSNYYKLTSPNYLCSESKPSCSALLKLNQFNDIKIEAIPPASNGRYTIEFWTMVTSSTELKSGYHVIWRNLASVSVIQDTSNTSTLNIYCWPQDSRTDLTTKATAASIGTLANTQNIVNYDVMNNTSYNQTWIWVRCAVSHTAMEYYLSSKTPKTLKGDLVNLNLNSDFPSRYFFGEGESTYLQISNANLNVNSIPYIRNVYLFKEYIPQSYKFNNIDLSKLTSIDFPSLVYSVNFLNYNKLLNRISYTVESNRTKEFIPSVYGSTLSFNNGMSVVKLCPPGMKYSSTTDSCDVIADCNLISLNASYCLGENTPLVCKVGFYFDSVTSSCMQSCSPGYIHPPNTSAMCNLACDLNSSNQCSAGFTASQITDLYNNYKCAPGYDRFAYKCYDQNTMNSSFLYFNGCLNFPSAQYTFNTDSFGGTYNIEFWIKVDKFGENICNSSFLTAGRRKVYFLAEPHYIYYDNTSNSVTYEMYNSKGSVKAILTNFSFFHWNHVIIQTNAISNSVKVIVNFNNFATTITTGDNDLTFNKIGFCSSAASCFSPVNKNLLLQSIYWGAAFYKNLRIWNGNSNQWLIQEYNNNVFSEFTSSLLIEYPLNIKYALDNKITPSKVLLPSASIIELNSDSNNIDKDTRLNFGSYLNIDTQETIPGVFIKSLDVSTKAVTTAACHKLCRRCVNTTICLECISGYKLFGNFCKKTTGSYLKLPMMTTSNSFLQLNVNNPKTNFFISQEKVYTFTIWIKLFGQVISASSSKRSDCFVIFKFNDTGSKYLCYNPSTQIIYFYSGSLVLFKDSTFVNSIGQWCLISLTSLMNNIGDDTNLKNYFQPVARMYSNTNEAEVVSQILTPGLSLETFDIGFEFSALVADFRFYRDFIVNPFGYVVNVYKSLNLAYYISFQKINNNCISDTDINTKTCPSLLNTGKQNYFNYFGLQCVQDFHPYLATEYSCPANYFLDRNSFTQVNVVNSSITPPCQKCHSLCAFGMNYLSTSNTQICSGTTSDKCTCIYSNTESWLRVGQSLQCEKVPYLEISRTDSTVLEGVKMARTREYTLEFWFFIYSYDTLNLVFDSHEIIWDLHTYIKFYTSNASSREVKVRCYPVYDMSNKYEYDNYLEDTISQAAMKWNYVSCSTQLDRNVAYINRLDETSLAIDSALKLNIENTSLYPSTKLYIQPGEGAKTNYGFLFIRELKLFSLYEIRKFNTKCKITSIASYYTDLLHYFANDASSSFLKDSVTNISVNMTPRKDFIGYNVINSGLNTSTDILLPVMTNCNGPSDGITIYPFTTGYNGITPYVFRSILISSDYLYRFYYIVRFKDNSYRELQPFDSNPELMHVFALDPSMITEVTTNQIRINLFLEVKYPTGAVVQFFREFKVTFSQPSSNTVLNSSDILLIKDVTSLMNDSFLLNRALVVRFLQTDRGNMNWELEPYVNDFNYNFEGKANVLPNFHNCFSTISSASDCNNRGFCATLDNVDLCICTKPFAGDKCQMSILPFTNWLSLHLAVLNAVYYKIVTFPSDISLTLNDEILQSLFVVIDSSKKVSLRTEILLNFLIQPIDVLFGNYYFNEENQVNKIMTKFSFELMKMLSDFYTITLRKMNKEKYDNLVSRLNDEDKIGNYTYHATPTRLLDAVYLNDLTRELASVIDTTKILLKIEDKTELFLTADKSALYGSYFEKYHKYLFTTIEGYLQVMNKEDYYLPNKYFVKNTPNFSIIIKKLIAENRNFSEIYNYDFYSDIFFNRKNKMKSYVEVSECLKEMYSKLNKNIADYETIYLVFVGFKSFPFAFDNDINKSFISLPHSIEFYDKNLKRIAVECPNSGIVHYQNLYSINLDFLEDYNTLPWKYLFKNYQDPYTIEPGRYRVPFIFPNGTIANSTYEEQVRKYYPQYSIYMSYLDKENENYTLYNPPYYIDAGVSSNSTVFTEGRNDPNNRLKFEEISNSGFIKGRSFTTGKMFVFLSKHMAVEYDSSISPLGIYKPLDTLFNSYYLAITNEMANFWGNKCFIILCLLILFHLIMLLYCFILYLLSLCCRNRDFYNLKRQKKFKMNKSSVFNFARYFNEIKFYIMTEKDLIESDNAIYKENRFVWIYNLNFKNEEELVPIVNFVNLHNNVSDKENCLSVKAPHLKESSAGVFNPKQHMSKEKDMLHHLNEKCNNLIEIKSEKEEEEDNISDKVSGHFNLNEHLSGFFGLRKKTEDDIDKRIGLKYIPKSQMNVVKRRLSSQEATERTYQIKSDRVINLNERSSSGCFIKAKENPNEYEILNEKAVDSSDDKISVEDNYSIHKKEGKTNEDCLPNYLSKFNSFITDEDSFKPPKRFFRNTLMNKVIRSYRKHDSTKDKYHVEWGIIDNNEFEGEGNFYNLFHFIFKRNIYFLNFNFNFDSYFSPKYKNISKLFCLIYLECLSILILLVASRTDLLTPPNLHSIYTELITGQIFAAVTFSNFIIIIISLIYKFDKEYRNDFITRVDKSHRKSNMALTPVEENEWIREINQFSRKNLIKTMIINIFNICLISVLTIVSVTFTSAFQVWQDSVLLIWILTLLGDFIFVEVFLEVVIWLLWICRENHVGLSRFFVGIKNLRNLY